MELNGMDQLIKDYLADVSMSSDLDWMDIDFSLNETKPLEQKKVSVPISLLESDSSRNINYYSNQVKPDDCSDYTGTAGNGVNPIEVISTSICGDHDNSTENDDTDIEPKEKFPKLENGGGEKRIRPTSYKAYHRQIEKRRRNKINEMIHEIASLVPMCQNVSHRLDKLSVLELAVQHMRMITNSSEAEEESVYKPTILSEDEIKYLLEASSEGFLLVLSSDKAQILHVSDAISNSTLHTPVELVGRSLLELVHTKDIPVITNMLAPYPSMPAITRIQGNSKDTTTSSKSSLGAKRSFMFRLKTSKQPQFDPANASKSNRYRQTIPGNTMIPVKCTGFLKSWRVKPSSSSSPTSSANIDTNVHLSTFSCFIAIAQPIKNSRTITSSSSPSSVTSSSSTDNRHTNNSNVTTVSFMPKKYSSRHAADARYLYVDNRVVPIAGYLPQDLIGNCEYEFIHKDDVQALSETYKQVLQSKNQQRIVSDVYRFKMKNGGMIPIRTVAFSFFNPFTKKLEFVSHENFVMSSKEMSEEMPDTKYRLSNVNTERLAFKARVDSAVKIHDCVNDQTPTSNNDGKNTEKSRHVTTANSSSTTTLLKPYSINVLKHSGINTDILNEILRKHETTDVNTDALDTQMDSYLKNMDVTNGLDTAHIKDMNHQHDKGMSSGYGSTCDDGCFS